MTFLASLRVTGMLCIFRLVLEEKVVSGKWQTFFNRISILDLGCFKNPFVVITDLSELHFR